jgi:hypothetical protein
MTAEAVRVHVTLPGRDPHAQEVVFKSDLKA